MVPENFHSKVSKAWKLDSFKCDGWKVLMCIWYGLEVKRTEALKEVFWKNDFSLDGQSEDNSLQCPLNHLKCKVQFFKMV